MSGAEHWDTLWIYAKAGSQAVLNASRKTLTIEVKSEFGEQPMIFRVDPDAFRSWASGSMFPFREVSDRPTYRRSRRPKA